MLLYLNPEVIWLKELPRSDANCGWGHYMRCNLWAIGSGEGHEDVADVGKYPEQGDYSPQSYRSLSDSSHDLVKSEILARLVELSWGTT